MGYMDIAARRRRRMGAAPPPGPSLSDQVQAMLSGTTGFAVDPSDAATMWQESTKTNQVTAGGQTVGAIATKWGTTAYDILQATGTARPTWNGSNALSADEVDDEMRVLSGAMLALTNNISAFFGAARFRVASLAAARGIFMFNTTGSSASRISLYVNADGSVGCDIRRLDADSATTVTSATGLVTTGVDYTLAVQVDYSTGGITLYLDNVSVGTGTHGSTGSTSATNSNRIGWGLTYGTTRYMPSRLGRGVVAPMVLTAGQRATVQSWLVEA